ncbi:MAG: DUF1150 family protein [Henriciella sp.]|nr:DUF1150 family protein [Henriciella sp.]
MNTPVNAPFDAIDVSQLAYVRSIKSKELAELPREALASVEDVDALFVLTNGDGKRLAIIEGRDAAIAAAHANALQTVSLH